MAAQQNDSTSSNILLRSRKRRQNKTDLSQKKLPTGPCNYTNLSIGVAARCGCQGYWDRFRYVSSQSQEVQLSHDICMCEHHACYHEFQTPPELPEPDISFDDNAGSLSQRMKDGDVFLPSTYHESPSRKRIPSKQSNIIQPQARYHTEPQWDESILSQVGHLGIDSATIDQGGSNLGQGGNDRPSSRPGLPPIPSQCLLPPGISSGSLDRSQSHLSFGKPRNRSFAGIQERSEKQDGESFNQSATEVVTPSPRSSPDLGDTSRFDRDIMTVQSVTESTTVDAHVGALIEPPDSRILDRIASPMLPTENVTIMQSPDTSMPFKILDTKRANTPLRQMIPHPQTVQQQLAGHPTLEDKVKNHSQRLDLLENASYSNAALEDVHEKFDLFDDRIVEVENKVDELERVQAALNDNSSVGSHRRALQQLHDANTSISSQTSSAMISAAIGRAELMSRIELLETQVSTLHASILPSQSNPWELEVIFLPSGSSLQGIWSPLNQFPSQRSRRSSMDFDDWTQTQFSTIIKTQANSTNSNASWEDLRDESEDVNNWLVAKACGPGSKVEERLRSRGLVRKISIKGSDARDVQTAMQVAFGPLLKTLTAPSPPKASLASIPSHLQAYHALYAPWIPLRKLHKDSRLRFLDPAEMVTPALWTAIFLSSNVAMRATGTKRLYVTQRDSYIQHHADHAGWSWQKLRELPRVYPDADSPHFGFHSSADVREADAREACWEWDERLDPPQSLHSSFVSHHSSLSIRGPQQENDHSRSSKSDRSSSVAPSPLLSTTPTSVAPGRAVSPLMERHVPRPLHSRTTSMPSMLHLHPLLSPSQGGPGKRRIASLDNEQSHHPSPSPVRLFAAKRQRLSRSPSRPRDTPRWSVGPPSPCFVEELPMDQKRGVTPLAYATPFSNAPYNEWTARSVGTPGLGIEVDDAGAEDGEGGSTTDEVEYGEQEIDEEEEEEEDDEEGFEQFRQHGDEEVWEGVEEDAADDHSGEGSGMEARALSVDDDGPHDTRNEENQAPSLVMARQEDDDIMSDSSSGPSEYPSTQPSASALYAGNRGAFLIHVDDDDDDDDEIV